MKHWSVTTRIKSTELYFPVVAIKKYFPVVLFIMLYKVVLTFKPVKEILKCDYSNKSY